MAILWTSNWRLLLPLETFGIATISNIKRRNKRGFNMHTLYDSERFAVHHVLTVAPGYEANSDAEALRDGPAAELQHGFEIVDKRWGKEIYLDGSWAELLAQRIRDWQLNTPTQEEVEETLEGYAELAQTPLYVH